MESAPFIGIDVGSSFVKGALLDPGTMTLRAAVRAPFPEFLPGLPERRCEVDPSAVMGAVEAVLAGLGTTEAAGLVLCGQMHGVVLVDEWGSAVSNYISWLDRRVTDDDFGEMTARVTEAERAELGNEFRASIAAGALYWLVRHGALPHGPVTPVSIADFVAGRLCGVPPVMDPTQAAAFGALRLRDRQWHDGVISKLGLDGLHWPEVRPTGSVVGTWRGAPCYASVGDQQCALAGALLMEDEFSVNIGTGSQVARILEGDLPAAPSCQIRPYFDGRYLQTITHIPGGRALSALVRLLTELGGVSEEAAWPEIETRVAAVAATDLDASAAFYPGPCGFGGWLRNLREENMEIGHVFRAVFESMAGNYAACAGRLDPQGTSRRIVFSGGVARRLELLRELTAAKLGLPYRLSPDAEDTLYGLMVLAGGAR